MNTLTFTPIINDNRTEQACQEIYKKTGMVPVTFSYVVASESMSIETSRLISAAVQIYTAFPDIDTLVGVEIRNDMAISNVVFFELEPSTPTAAFDDTYIVVHYSKRDDFVELDPYEND